MKGKLPLLLTGLGTGLFIGVLGMTVIHQSKDASTKNFAVEPQDRDTEVAPLNKRIAQLESQIASLIAENRELKATPPVPTNTPPDFTDEKPNPLSSLASRIFTGRKDGTNSNSNATRVFWGTAWTSQTLLAREKRAALEAQKKDGCQRVFEIDAAKVGKEVPAYEKFVESEVAKHGRTNPFILTQYFSQEIDAQTGNFTITAFHQDYTRRGQVRSERSYVGHRGDYRVGGNLDGEILQPKDEPFPTRGQPRLVSETDHRYRVVIHEDDPLHLKTFTDTNTKLGLGDFPDRRQL